ncbi:hypothetical protein SD70_04340 [Gordoniibacillus kamchatkensis]|uniref:Uncharacterized protein n=1 Tax=Gordoniibacillus kamchatkensis TaxID=1590651 RepID=A0ABR5ALC2_9BACL|nr:hypothetical protein SD70_04340 [Paenibacillus sp. VKM B-2647]
MYIRLMVLKHKYNLGYESLVKVVGDSITRQLLFWIAIDEPMPDPSKLMLQLPEKQLLQQPGPCTLENAAVIALDTIAEALLRDHPD